MATIIDKHVLSENKMAISKSKHQEDVADEHSIATAITHSNPTTQFLLASKLITHAPDAGLNPLVDAAAYLFSLMGKLKHIKSYRNLAKLSAELIQEIQNFQESAKTYSYTTQSISEYIPVTCYALCVTLDDIISNTSWGSEGRWDEHSLLVAFNQDSISRESFFIILERLIRDPALYIDVMEFMYVCLSLGFKGHYNHSAFDRDQLEQITNSLYKRIRAHRGDFSKTLSPFHIKPRAQPANQSRKNSGPWLSILLSCSFIAILVIGAKLLLDFNSNRLTQRLIQTENLIPYEINNQFVKS